MFAEREAVQPVRRGQAGAGAALLLQPGSQRDPAQTAAAVPLRVQERPRRHLLRALATQHHPQAVWRRQTRRLPARHRPQGRQVPARETTHQC